MADYPCPPQSLNPLTIGNLFVVTNVTNTAAKIAENFSFHVRAPFAYAGKTDASEHASDAVAGLAINVRGPWYIPPTRTLGTFRRKRLLA